MIVREYCEEKENRWCYKMSVEHGGNILTLVEVAISQELSDTATIEYLKSAHPRNVPPQYLRDHSDAMLAWFEELGEHRWQCATGLYNMFLLATSEQAQSRGDAEALVYHRHKSICGLWFLYCVDSYIQMVRNNLSNILGDDEQIDQLAIVREIPPEGSLPFPNIPVHIPFILYDNLQFRRVVFTSQMNAQNQLIEQLSDRIKIIVIFGTEEEDLIARDFLDMFQAVERELEVVVVNNQEMQRLLNKQEMQSSLHKQQSQNCDILVQYVGHYAGLHAAGEDPFSNPALSVVDLISSQANNVRIINLTSCETATAWREVGNIGIGRIMTNPALGLAQHFLARNSVHYIYGTLWVTYSNHLSEIVRQVYQSLPGRNPAEVLTETIRNQLKTAQIGNECLWREYANRLHSSSGDCLRDTAEVIYRLFTLYGYVCIARNVP